MTDRLRWWEEIPLGLALLAQSYVVGLWYFASIKGASQEADLMVAIGAGLALDLIVVTTVMGRRQGRSSGWSWATSFGAFGCSSAIALDRYGWEWRSLLHVAFPLVVFLYSQHLATPSKAISVAQATSSKKQAIRHRFWRWLTQWFRRRPAQASQEAPGATEGATLHIDVLIPDVADSALPVEPMLSVVSAPRYVCPWCHNEVASKQAKGSAARYGCDNVACPGRSNRKEVRKAG